MRNALSFVLFPVVAALPSALAAQGGVFDDIDLELVLLADASGSIDQTEIMFQRRRYAEAITDPAVLKAITGGAHGEIAVAYVEWASVASQNVVVDWTVIRDAETAAAFVAALLAPPRRAFGRNAIGAALMKGVEMIASNDHEGFRKVIDFSADSANNWSGPPIAERRAAAVAAGITINGLAVLCRVCDTGRPVSYDLEAAFRERIIAGPGAFVVTADGDAAFSVAVRRKLILEIAGGEREAERRLASR